MTRFIACMSILLICVAVLAFAPAALAVDGVVLINQNTSVAGIEGCPHAGFPIVICRSGSYRLSGNLTISNVNIDGIDIKADDVTLDLNGFTIAGPVTCTPVTFPVQCSGTGTGVGISGGGTGITVRNGVVRGMGNSGIVLGSSLALTQGYVIDGVQALSNGGATGAGIEVNNGVVTHCIANVNAGHGIVANIGATITSNSVSLNGGNGIFGGGTVSNNTSSNNGQDGINNAAYAVANTIFANVGFGIAQGFLGRAYGANVMFGNGGTASGVTSLGNNLCDGVAC